MAKCEEQRIRAVTDSFTKANEDITYSRRLAHIQWLMESFDYAICEQNGIVDGAIFYYNDGDTVVVPELFSISESPLTLMRLMLKAIKGAKSVLFKVALDNEKMLSFYKRRADSLEVVDGWAYGIIRRKKNGRSNRRRRRKYS
jgi:hypothetical protein